MNNIIKEVLNFKKNQENSVFKKILDNFNRKIKSSVQILSKEDQADCIQEIYLNIYLYVCKFKVCFNYSPSDKYVESFFEVNNIKKCDLKTNRCLFYEYCLFCNENQFVSYCNKIIESKVSNYKKNNKLVSLNTYNFLGTELIETINDKSEEMSNIYDCLYFLSNEEKRLIKNIYIDKLTEKEVAYKMNISQQAISRAKLKILKKIRNRL